MPFKFVLYSHVDIEHQERLLGMQAGLRKLLRTDGLLVLFIDRGLPDLLKHVRTIQREISREEAKKAKSKLKENLSNRLPELQDGEVVGRGLDEQLGPQVRVLTALDLVDVFGEMSNVKNLQEFLMGRDGEMRYDTPKFIESIVRLRMIGSRVPVLRIDNDVLIPEAGAEFNCEKLRLAINDICEEIATHHEHTQMLATIISASYEVPEETNTSVMAWCRGFATRIQPTLLVPKNAEYSNQGIESVLQDHFSPKLTMKYLNQLHNWGAPKTAVISGALLYMNDAVVLNVPPFSNFSQRVMWIDDHLRYVLHRELGDFCKTTKTAQPSTIGEKLLHVQSTTQVTKYRRAEPFVKYTITSYLPSLLWGSFVDYWLCPSTLPKLRFEDVASTQRDEWKRLRHVGRPGPLAEAVYEARAGYAPDTAKLREKLEQQANERLGIVIEAWRSLIDTSGRQSIASGWANGDLPDFIKDELGEFPSKLPDNVAEFGDDLQKAFDALLDDVCAYVEWVAEWPRVASVIRSIPPGEFRSDLEWYRH